MEQRRTTAEPPEVRPAAFATIVQAQARREATTRKPSPPPPTTTTAIPPPMPSKRTIRNSPETERRSQGTNSRTSSGGSRDPDGVAPLRPVPRGTLPRIFRPDEERPLPPEIELNSDGDEGDGVSGITISLGVNSMGMNSGATLPHPPTGVHCSGGASLPHPQVERPSLHPPRAVLQMYEQQELQQQQTANEWRTFPASTAVVAQATPYADDATISALQVEAIVEEESVDVHQEE